MSKVLVVFVFMLLRNRNKEYEWSKTFEAFLSEITVASNIFKQTKIQMDNVSYGLFYIVEKMWLLNEGTFALASSVHEVPVILKWNDLQSRQSLGLYIETCILYNQFLLSKIE